MKRTIALLLVLLSFLSLAACGGVKSTVSSPDDLPGKKIGYIDNSLAEYAVNSDFSEERTRGYSSVAQAADDLKTGVLDCIISDREDTSSIKSKAHGLKVLSEPAISLDIGFLCARAHGDLADVLGRNISALADSGVKNKITARYINGKKYEYVPSGEDFSETFTVAVFVCGAPYVFYNDDGELTGLEIDMTRAVCDLLGIGTEFVVLSREEAEADVLTGRADFAVGFFYPTGVNQELAVVSSPYYTADQMIITRK